VDDLKILWIDHIYLDSALYSTFPLLLIDSLHKNNHEVRLVIPSINKKDKAIASSMTNVETLPSIRLPLLSSLSFYFMLLFYLPQAIKKTKPHAIIVDIYALPGIIPSILFRNVKVIMDVRSSFIRVKGIRGHIGKMKYFSMITLAKHLCDRITVTSSALKEELCDVFGIDRAMVKVLTNGVSLDLFDHKKYGASSKNLKKQLNLDEKFIVFYHGSSGMLRDTARDRGVPQTAEAIARLVPKYPEITLFLLGLIDKNLQNELEFLNGNVYIHGAVSHNEVPKFISMCDVGIAAFDTFSFPRTSCPLKILEYLAMETIVIATDIPFNRELLSYGDCIFLIPSNSPENIAEAIEYVYKNKEALKRMGKIGRTIVEQHYTWESKAKDVVAFIEELYQNDASANRILKN
jgi:glycosyltransferase involved in cell wall biosynthesis